MGVPMAGSDAILIDGASCSAPPREPFFVGRDSIPQANTSGVPVKAESGDRGGVIT